MIAYFLLIATLFVCAAIMKPVYYYEEYHKRYRVTESESKKLLGCIIGIIALSILMGFRYKVGADYSTYVEIWNEYVYSDFSGRFSSVEKGYIYLNLICASIWQNPRLLFCVTALIINAFICNTIMRESPDCFLSWITYIGLGFYFNAMNVQRSFMAVSICIYASRYIFQKKFIKYLIFILIASSFHKSAIIMLPIFFLVHINKRIFYPLCFAGALMCAWSIRPLLIRFNIYTNYLNTDNGFISFRISWFNIILAVLVLTLCAIHYKSLIEADCYNEFRVKFIWIALLIYTCLSSFGDAASRIAFYFTIHYITLLPQIILCTQKNKRLLYKFVYVFLCLAFFYVLINSTRTGNTFIPYRASLLA